MATVSELTIISSSLSLIVPSCPFIIPEIASLFVQALSGGVSLTVKRAPPGLTTLLWCCDNQPKKNFNFLRAVVVAQLVERLLLIPEIRNSNPVIGKLYITYYITVN